MRLGIDWNRFAYCSRAGLFSKAAIHGVYSLYEDADESRCASSPLNFSTWTITTSMTSYLSPTSSTFPIPNYDRTPTKPKASLWVDIDRASRRAPRSVARHIDMSQDSRHIYHTTSRPSSSSATSIKYVYFHHWGCPVAIFSSGRASDYRPSARRVLSNTLRDTV